jgi:hypothetical protein
MTSEELCHFITGETRPENLFELKYRYRQKTERLRRVMSVVDPKMLDQAGWGIIFPHNADPAIKEALSALLELRQTQAGKLFRLFEGQNGHRPGESKSKFLARHGVGPGPVDPDRMPYYLLIVGTPEAIPFPFQYQLDVQYAVGRICFDTLDEYASYARSVVEVETGSAKLSPQVTLFGVTNPDDVATRLSTELLVEPLGRRLTESERGWNITAILRDDALKARLSQLLGGKQTPALLLTSSHGLEFPLGDRRQAPHQGALLCRDWPGPRHWPSGTPIPQQFYFAADDVSDDANLLGLVAFFFACYGGGTPLNDAFSRIAFKQRKAVAPYPFVAGLPKRLLGHPRGGALAVIGHVERAWTFSFRWPGAGAQTAVFESVFHSLLDGHPVGAAMEYFDERWSELATVLSDELEEIEFGKVVDPYELASLWTSNNDARGYVVIGDPAVRLPVQQVATG